MSRAASSDQTTSDRLSEYAREVADAEAPVREAGQKAREASSEALQGIEGFVRENPLISLGLAFAAGTLVIALTRRS